MPRSHNKKRNVGIIYEQIINFVCGRLLEEDKKSAEEVLPKVIGLIDRVAKRNIIHKNKAANLKSAVSKSVAAIA